MQKPVKKRLKAVDAVGWSWTDYLLLGGFTVAVSVGVALALKYFFGDGDATAADNSLRKAPAIAATDASLSTLH